MAIQTNNAVSTTIGYEKPSTPMENDDPKREVLSFYK